MSLPSWVKTGTVSGLTSLGGGGTAVFATGSYIVFVPAITHLTKADLSETFVLTQQIGYVGDDGDIHPATGDGTWDEGAPLLLVATTGQTGTVGEIWYWKATPWVDNSGVRRVQSAFAFNVAADATTSIGSQQPLPGIPPSSGYIKGDAGPPPNLTMGTVTTLAPGDDATADFTGTTPNYTLELGIPAGVAGADGADGTDGADGINLPPGGTPAGYYPLSNSGGTLTYTEAPVITTDNGALLLTGDSSKPMAQCAASPAVSGDLDMRFDGLVPGTIASGANQTLAAIQSSGTSSWWARLSTTGQPTLLVYASPGTTAVTATSTAILTTAALLRRITWRQSDGKVRFWVDWAGARTSTTGAPHAPASKLMDDVNGNFTADDVGRLLTSSLHPDGTTVAAVNSSTQIQASNAATSSTTGLHYTLGAVLSDGSKLALIGTDRTASTSGAALFTSSTIPLSIGAAGNGAAGMSAGTKLGKFRLYAGIENADGTGIGTLKADPTFTGHDFNDNPITDAESNVFNILGSARIIPKSVTAERAGVTVKIAAQSDVQAAAGGWGSARVNPVTGKFHVSNFGPVGVDPATWTVAQQTAAIMAARAAMIAAISIPNKIGQTLYFDRPYTINADTSLLDPISGLPYCALPTWDYATYEGDGMMTPLTLAPGQNCRVIGHPGRLQANGSQDQIFNFSIKNMVIDGGIAGQDGCHMHDGIHLTMHPGLSLTNVWVRNCDGNGYWSSALGEFGANAFTVGNTVWTTNTAPTSIVVGSTSGFPSSGQLAVFDGGGNQVTVNYTGISGSSTFTGVTLASSTPLAVAGTVVAGSQVQIDPGAHVVRPVTLTDVRFTGNAKWGAFCAATNREVSYKGIHADNNGSPQALIAGRTVCATIGANGHVDLVVDDGTNVAVSLVAGRTPAQIASDITAGLASMTKTPSVTFTAATDAVTFGSAHKAGVGTPIVFSGMTGGAGITAGTTYYVHQVLSSTSVTLTATFGGIGFGSTIDITSDGTGTASYGTPVASLTPSGLLLIASGIWGGTSRVYLQTTSTPAILVNLGLSLNPILGDNNFRAGSQEYGGVRYDQSESVSSDTWADSNFGDGVYFHNVNQRADTGVHSTRNTGLGIYVDAWCHSQGVAWDASMNCTDFGYASYRVDGYGSSDTAELYFDNGTEGYGVTHDSTLMGFVGPGDKKTIGGKADNRCANYSIYIAHGVAPKSTDPILNAAADQGLDIVFPKYGDGGLLGFVSDNR